MARWRRCNGFGATTLVRLRRHTQADGDARSTSGYGGVGAGPATLAAAADGGHGERVAEIQQLLFVYPNLKYGETKIYRKIDRKPEFSLLTPQPVMAHTPAQHHALPKHHHAPARTTCWPAHHATLRASSHQADTTTDHRSALPLSFSRLGLV